MGDATKTGILTFGNPAPAPAGTVIAGTTSLTIAGSYVVFTGSLSGTGAFTLLSGELDLEGPIGTKSGGTILSGGTLYLGFGKSNNNQLGSDSLTINSGSAFFCASVTVNTTITNTITGSGGFLYARPRNGTVTFSAASGYTGTFRIFAGTSDGAVTTTQGMTLSAFPTGASDFTFINQNTGTAVTQTFKYTGSANVNATTPSMSMVPSVAGSVGVWHHAPSNGTATMSFAGAVAGNTTVAHTIQLTNDSSGLLSFTGGIDQRNTGVLTLTKTGTGPVSVSGTGTYTGSVSITTGTFNANSATALGADTSSISVSPTTTLTIGAATNYSVRTLGIQGTGAGASPAGALVLNYVGTAKLGPTTLSAATFIRGTQTGTLTLTSLATGGNTVILGTASDTTFTPNFIINNTGAVVYGNSSSDTGVVIASNQHTYTGNTTLAYGVTQPTVADITGSGPFGNKALNVGNTLLMTGGTLRYSTANNLDYSGRFTTAGNQQWKIDTNSRAVTFSFPLQGTGSSLSVYDTGTGGELTVSSLSSNFPDGVNLYSGRLVAGAPQTNTSGPLGTGLVYFQSGTLVYTSTSASYDYSARFSTANGQSRSIDVGGQSVTFVTALGGTNSLALVGSAGTLTLAAANTYTQGTTLSVGTLKCGNAASLGTGGLAQANDTVLQVTATGGKLTIQGAHTNPGIGPRTIRIGA